MVVLELAYYSLTGTLSSVMGHLSSCFTDEGLEFNLFVFAEEFDDANDHNELFV